jgi:hypothetical protein
MEATTGPRGWGAGRFSGGQVPHWRLDGWPHSCQNLAETEKKHLQLILWQVEEVAFTVHCKQFSTYVLNKMI